MTCAEPRFQQSLEALIAGELSPRAFAELRAHATRCDACRSEYERWSRVETHLERRALPKARQDLLEGELFARLGVSAPASTAKVLRPARWSLRRAAPIAVPLAASVALALLLVPKTANRSEGEFQARGAAAGTAFGIRAFCVSSEGAVVAEAGPGQTLRCAPGSSIQFSHTADAPVQLSIVGQGTEALNFFPGDGSTAAVRPGVDVALPHSTPVTSEWLDRRIPVTATFRNEAGEVVARTELQLEPANESRP